MTDEQYEAGFCDGESSMAADFNAVFDRVGLPDSICFMNTKGS